MINNNYIDAENNYSVDINLETGTFSSSWVFKGKFDKKIYPLGTTRTDVFNEMEVIFEGVG